MKELFVLLVFLSSFTIMTAWARQEDVTDDAGYNYVEKSNIEPLGNATKQFSNIIDNPFLAKSSGNEDANKNSAANGWYVGGGVGASDLSN